MNGKMALTLVRRKVSGKDGVRAGIAATRLTSDIERDSKTKVSLRHDKV